VWQHGEACQQRVDADGNWRHQTDGKIQDKAIEREVEEMGNTSGSRATPGPWMTIQPSR
jgi:hypothetical protein